MSCKVNWFDLIIWLGRVHSSTIAFVSFQLCSLISPPLYYLFFLSAPFYSLAAKGAKLWLDTSCVNAAIVSIFRSACERHFTRLATKSRKQLNNGASSDLISIKSEDIRNGIPNGLYKVSPVAIAKAVKNKAEIEGMKNSHLR